MMARSAWRPGRLPGQFLGGAVLALLVLLGAARSAHAQMALFGSYWDNIARATAQNDALKVRQLVGAGNNPNQVDDDGRTGLQIAAINGNLQIAAILIKASAHLDLKDKLGNTALHYAIDRNRVEMAQLLLDVGAAVDPDNKNGMTPLMIAASRGNMALVQALLAKGANVRKTDFTGRDALGWAAESHRPAVVQALQRAAAKR
jgi:ankyrin repeat protein